jgi:hypothetical protein
MSGKDGGEKVDSALTALFETAVRTGDLCDGLFRIGLIGFLCLMGEVGDGLELMAIPVRWKAPFLSLKIQKYVQYFVNIWSGSKKCQEYS